MYKVQEPKGLAASLHRASTIRLKSFDGGCWHKISLEQKTCDCEEFRSGGECEHLNALGIYRFRPFTPTVCPTFSQALSGLVKSIRIRWVDEAIYWLAYLDTFQEKQHRFRTARRLLIGAAEDGHSIAVMEGVATNFRAISRQETGLLNLVEEVMRICRLPNWWHPDSGGPEYIYHSMVGQRKWRYKQWDRRRGTLEKEIAAAIKVEDKEVALGGVMAYAYLNKGEKVGATKKAEFLLSLAESNKNDLASRLCKVHLSQKSALSGDDNYLCQAAWYLAGGNSPVAEKMEPVTPRECYQALERARKALKTSHKIPTWSCDGIHSAGNDTRFMGMFDQMIQVVNAYRHYGRVDPADKWLPCFACHDGLIIEAEKHAGDAV